MPPRVIYLDNHSTTQVDERVVEQMAFWMKTAYGNPHSRDHLFGEEAAAAVENARQSVASLVNASEAGVVFTSGATESINLALRGFCEFNRTKGKDTRIALPPTEHSAVIETCQELNRRSMAALRWLVVDSSGRVDLEDVEAACREGLDLMCLMGANNEIGNIYPWGKIGNITAEHGVGFFCDGSQAVGKTTIEFENSNMDFLAVSAHKFYGPKGIGALIVRDPSILRPIQYGGPHENGLRPGTLNVPGIVGLGYSCRLRQLEMGHDEAIIKTKRDRLESLLLEEIPDMRVNGDPEHRLSGNLHISIRGVPNDAIIARVRDRLAISTGAACSSGIDAPSHVLRAIGLDEDLIDGSLRICVGKFNTDSEIDEAAKIISAAVQSIVQVL